MSPSWLAFDNSRYAIRTVVRLDVKSIKPQLAIPYTFIVVGVLLMIYSLYHFSNDSLSTVVPWFMLIASLALCVLFGFVVFNARITHHLVVTFIDGSKLPITAQNIDQANNLLNSLTKAMDWHRSTDVVLDAQRKSHVRKGYAASSWADEEEEEEESEETYSAYDQAARNAENHPTKVNRRSAQMMAAFLIAMRKKWRK
ncbi:MAG: DUF6232 family protein [Granulosicoccus sp.]